MGTYRVDGVSREWGEAMTLVVEAESAHEAMAKGVERGMTVSNAEAASDSERAQLENERAAVASLHVAVTATGYQPGAMLGFVGVVLGWVGVVFFPSAIAGLVVSAAAYEVSKGVRGRGAMQFCGLVLFLWTLAILALVAMQLRLLG